MHTETQRPRGAQEINPPKLILYRTVFRLTLAILAGSIVIGLLSNLIRFREFPSVRIDLVRDPEIAMTKGEFSTALQQYTTEARLTLDPEANAKIGKVYLEMKDFERARIALEKAISVNPALPETQARLAIALQNLAEPEKAGEAFQIALQLKPSSIQIRSAYAAFLESQGNVTESIGQYRMIIEKADDKEASRAYESIGFLLSESKDPHAAEESFHNALKLNAENSQANSGLAILLAKQKKFAEAVQYFEVAIKLEPSNQEFLWNYANVLRDSGQIDRAVEQFIRLKEMTGDKQMARDVDTILQMIRKQPSQP